MQELSEMILVSKEKNKAVISLNRPPANSYFHVFLKQLSALINELNSDKKIKVVVLNSTSERFFCAGADIKIFSSNTTEQNDKMVLAAREVCEMITESDKIFISAICGHVLGGGLEMAMACDIRLASEGNYLIGLPEVKLGLMPGNGGTPRMIDLIGASRAIELLLTGNNIDPLTAWHYGLFNQLFKAGEFEEKVNDYADNLANGAGLAMATIKRYVQNHKGMNLQQALNYETECAKKLYETHDAKEGFLAFVEKRKPNFN